MSLRIDVGDRFRRQDFPISAALQPTDYTAYPTGERKIGVISQVGDVEKKKADTKSFKARIAVSSLVKGGTSPVAVGQAKALPNMGIISAFDKFFSWLNGVIGE